MDGQDWSSVVLKKNTGKSAGTAGSARPPVSAAVVAARKLDGDDVPTKPTRVLSAESKQGIIQARVALKMNQVHLNQTCGFPANTVRDIENGKLVPSPQQLTVLSRVLKTIVKYA